MTRSPLATLRTALAGGAALAALAGAAIGLSAAPAHAAAAPAATGLPAPDGLPIGLARLHVVDRARTDPYSHHGPREIPVSAFYPARRASPTPFPYVAPALQEPLAPAFGVPAAAVAELRTHAGLGAAPRPGRHPIVVVATGYGVPSLAMTLLAEDMAAHGWVALVIDSPGESPAVELADGRVRVAAAPESMRAVRRALRIREATSARCSTACPRWTAAARCGACSTAAASPWRATPSVGRRRRTSCSRTGASTPASISTAPSSARPSAARWTGRS